MSTLESGWVMFVTVEVNKPGILVEQLTKESGETMCPMVKEPLRRPMAMCMKGTGLKAKHMDMEYSLK